MPEILPTYPRAERTRLSGPLSADELRAAAAKAAPMLDSLATLPFPEPAASPPPQALRIGAWNIQQCHYAEESGALLARAGLDIALLSELDVGLARTGQRNTVAALATAQGHGAVYAAEFLELQGAAGDEAGWHCNAVTARAAPLAIRLIRLPEEGDWLINPRRGQRRFGGRMALAARFAVAGGTLVACAVHLESDTDGAGRARQMAALLDELDAFADGAPVLLGGDLNAGARRDDFDPFSEPFFDLAARRGFSWKAFNTGMPTSRVSRNVNAVQQNRARFDWFLGRDLTGEAASNIPAVDADGAALSDHDVITVVVRPE